MTKLQTNQMNFFESDFFLTVIHLYHGRWSCHWRTAHERWCRGKDPDTIYPNGGDWVCVVGGTLLSGWFELWALRNQERHTKNSDKQNDTIHAVVRSQLQEIYSYRNRVRPMDRDIFCYESLEEHMANGSPMAAIQDWCSDSFPAVLASVSLAAKEGVQKMQEYRTILQVVRLSRRVRPYPRFRRTPGVG